MNWRRRAPRSGSIRSHTVVAGSCITHFVSTDQWQRQDVRLGWYDSRLHGIGDSYRDGARAFPQALAVLRFIRKLGLTNRRTQLDTRLESIDFRNSISYSSFVAALPVSSEWP